MFHNETTDYLKSYGNQKLFIASLKKKKKKNILESEGICLMRYMLLCNLCCCRHITWSLMFSSYKPRNQNIDKVI